MKKWLLTIGIVTLFIGMTFLPSASSTIAEEPEIEGPGWKYFAIGRISNYKIVDVNGTEYIRGRAVRLRVVMWNIFKNHPRVPFVKTFRLFWEFNLPYEGVKILKPGLLGRGFLVASGTL